MKPRTWKRRVARYAALLVAIVLVVVIVSSIAESRRQAHYDRMPAPATLTAEDVFFLVESYKDGVIEPCERVLFRGVEERIADAKRRDANLYLHVGHLAPEQWFDFDGIESLLAYCRNYPGSELHVEKEFKAIRSPGYCMGGWGAYLELDSDLNFKALWIYQPRIPSLVFRFSPVEPWQFRFTQRLATRVDKEFGWERFPSPLLAEKLEPSTDTWHVAVTRRSLEERVIARLQDTIENNSKTSEGPRALLGALEKSVSHADLYRTIERIRRGELEARPSVDSSVMKILYRMGTEPDGSLSTPTVADCLFQAGYWFTRYEPAVYAVECFETLIERYPESRCASSALLYLGDAYASLAWRAPGVSRNAAAEYYRRALAHCDEVIEKGRRGEDSILLGEELHCLGGSELTDEMLGESAAKWAKTFCAAYEKQMGWYVDKRNARDPLGSLLAARRAAGNRAAK